MQLPMSSFRGCDVAFLPGAIVITILRLRPRSWRSRARLSRSRPRARTPKSRLRLRGRGRGQGHRDRGHRLEAEFGEVEAVRSARSRSTPRGR
jgi:hypothetical protein